MIREKDKVMKKRKEKHNMVEISSSSCCSCLLTLRPLCSNLAPTLEVWAFQILIAGQGRIAYATMSQSLTHNYYSIDGSTCRCRVVAVAMSLPLPCSCRVIAEVYS